MMLVQTYFFDSALKISLKDPLEFVPDWALELPPDEFDLSDMANIGSHYQKAELNFAVMLFLINSIFIVGFLVIALIPGAEN
jgi:hypothetical protein